MVVSIFCYRLFSSGSCFTGRVCFWLGRLFLDLCNRYLRIFRIYGGCWLLLRLHRRLCERFCDFYSRWVLCLYNWLLCLVL